MVEINLNDNITVRLTPYAIEIMRENHFKLFNGAKHAPEFNSPKQDADGWSEIQMWKFMQEFGDAMYMGNPRQIVYENKIRIQNEYST